MPDGGFVVAATTELGGKKVMRLLRYTQGGALKGQALWDETLPASVGELVARGLVARKAGGLVALGQAPAGPVAALVSTTALGKILWTASLPAAPGTEVRGIALRGDGSHVAVGQAGLPQPTGKTWVVGPWGNAKCPDTKCATLPDKPCNDGNHCTSDLCQVTTGTCAQISLAPGTPCGWGGTCGGGGFVGTCLDQCGDQITTGNETCDDGNHVNGDGCAANCLKE